MNEEREVRIGRNEALFREINERMESLQQAFDAFTEQADFVCECGDVACAEQLTMSLSDYERLRSNPTWFAIKPGHEVKDVEDVVEKRPGYDIVSKHEGVPADIARAEDPRSET
jgi:hypothetical protein